MEHNNTQRILYLVIISFMVMAGGFAQNKKNQKKGKQEESTEIKAFVQTIVSRQNVNPSDTLTLTYRLYSTHELEDFFQDPTYSQDFYMENVTPRRQVYKEEKIKGETYKVVDLKKYIVQPAGTGTKMIPSRRFVLKYAIPTGRIVVDYWGTKYEETLTERKEVEAGAVQIQVLQMVEI